MANDPTRVNGVLHQYVREADSFLEWEYLEQRETQQPDVNLSHPRPTDVASPSAFGDSASSTGQDRPTTLERNEFLSHKPFHVRKKIACKSVTSSSPSAAQATAGAAAQTRQSSPERRPTSPLLTQSKMEIDHVRQDSSSNDTVINGRGIWNSWTRNFSMPLLALLDLLDNAFDAASLTEKGKISIQSDRELDGSAGSRKGTITGIAIFNSSIQRVKPLHKVLEVYTSLKGASADSIGENGVGLKQGCATLSDLSFCLASNRRRMQHGMQYEFSMGVLSLQLQTDRKCSLPSFQFKSCNAVEIKLEMLSLFRDEHPEIGDCVRAYGNSKHAESEMDPEDQLLAGIDRLVHHFEYMTGEGWGQYHVFGLVLDHLKHGTPTGAGKRTVEDDHESQKNRVFKLLEQVYYDLPSRYLHIPNLLDVRVGNKKVNFNYWQPRLVEMVQFDLEINKDIPIASDPFWKSPSLAPLHQRSSYYKIRIYIGFDALRVNNDKASKSACLHYYSRQSGRQIRKNNDARGELGLTYGGTDYCQGLTILLDDETANLPLNPTKQDLAFSEHANGETHKRNLIAWVNAATRLYYNFFRENIFFKQKRNMTNALTDMVPCVNSCIASSVSFTSLRSCSFSTFGDFAGSVQNHSNIIRLLSWKSLEYIQGKDTKLRFPRSRPASSIIPVTRKRMAPSHEVSEEPTSKQLSPTVRQLPATAVAVAPSNVALSVSGRYTERAVPTVTVGEAALDCSIAQSLTQNHQQGPSNRETELIREVQTLRAQLEMQTRRAQMAADDQQGRQTELIRQEREQEKHEEEHRNELTKRHELDKKLLRLKQNITVLKQENEDLKRQVAGLELTIKSKEQTILTQRNMIDNFDRDEGEDEVMIDDDERVESGYRDVV